MTDTPEPVALKACPWCGTTEHLSMQASGSLTGDMPDRPYRVVCTHIDHDTVVGPTAYGKTAARIAWNTRPDADIVRQLVEAIDGLMNMPGDVDRACNSAELRKSVLAARLTAWGSARAALTAARAAGYGGDHG